MKYFVGMEIVLNFASAFAPERGLAMRSLNELDINEQKQHKKSSVPSRYPSGGTTEYPYMGKKKLYTKKSLILAQDER